MLSDVRIVFPHKWEISTKEWMLTVMRLWRGFPPVALSDALVRRNVVASVKVDQHLGRRFLNKKRHSFSWWWYLIYYFKTFFAVLFVCLRHFVEGRRNKKNEPDKESYWNDHFFDLKKKIFQWNSCNANVVLLNWTLTLDLPSKNVTPFFFFGKKKTDLETHCKVLNLLVHVLLFLQRHGGLIQPLCTHVGKHWTIPWLRKTKATELPLFTFLTAPTAWKLCPATPQPDADGPHSTAGMRHN